MKKVFISYSHKDKKWKGRLVEQLKAVEKVTDISAWNDRKIGAGEKWFREIEKALKEAHIAVLLISAISLVLNL
jgi:replicative DNA helicase